MPERWTVRLELIKNVPIFAPLSIGILHATGELSCRREIHDLGRYASNVATLVKVS